jgi:hypothetical protein
LGLTGSSVSLFATGIYGVVKLVAVIVFLVFIADSLGRRRSLLWTSVAQGLCMLYIGLYVRISPPSPGQAIPPAGYMALVCIYLFAIFFQFGWSGACWILAAEIPTLRLRAASMSMAVAAQWLFQFVISRAVPPMLANVGKGGYGTYIIFFCFSGAMFVFVWFFVPETKGLSLEQMDALFGTSQAKADDEESRLEKPGRVNVVEIEERT